MLGSKVQRPRVSVAAYDCSAFGATCPEGLEMSAARDIAVIDVRLLGETYQLVKSSENRVSE